MSVFLPTFVAAIILAGLSHYHSAYGRHQSKDRLFYVMLTIVLILFAGLRTHYNDTVTYISSYKNADATRALSEISWMLGDNPGYAVVQILMKRWGVSVQSYLMIYAAVTIGIYMWFLRKYTNNIWYTVFLFIVVGNYTFTLAAIKQCIAIAFCLVGVDRAIRKKWIPFALWVLLGATFHAYSLMYLLVPFLTFRPWGGKSWALVVIFLFAGPLIQPLMGVLIDVTTMLGEEYDASTFVGEGVNPMRLAVVWVPVLLSFLVRRHIAFANDRTTNVILNLTMLNALIMYVALFGTANYFARLANYFVIFQALSLPLLLPHFHRDSRSLLIGASVIGYLGYFYYGNAIASPLDGYYSATTLWSYLQSLFA